MFLLTHLLTVKTPLIVYTGYVLINGKWYINWIMTEEKKSNHILSFPIPSYIPNPPDENLHPNENKDIDED